MWSKVNYKFKLAKVFDKFSNKFIDKKNEKAKKNS